MKLFTVIKITKTVITLWRVIHMYKKTTNVIKGIGAGLAVGTAAIAIGSQMAKSRKKPAKNLKKSAGKAVHTVGTIIGDVEKILR